MNKFKEKIIGTWEVQEHTMEIDGESNIICSFSKKPAGFITYTVEHISEHIMHLEQKNFNNHIDIKAERADAFRGYAGNYKIFEDKVIHYPIHSSYIESLNNSLERKYQFINNKLILSGSEFNPQFGKKVTSVLTWNKVHE
ncbi:MAG: hypothetical protein S4CHLAM7_07800 [Chlamydiae bacterium]|nr:hypothetical protein [Chlamydiota bacterium]